MIRLAVIFLCLSAAAAHAQFDAVKERLDRAIASGEALGFGEEARVITDRGEVTIGRLLNGNMSLSMGGRRSDCADLVAAILGRGAAQRFRDATEEVTGFGWGEAYYSSSSGLCQVWVYLSR